MIKDFRKTIKFKIKIKMLNLVFLPFCNYHTLWLKILKTWPTLLHNRMGQFWVLRKVRLFAIPLGAKWRNKITKMILIQKPMRATHLKVLFSKNSRGHSNLLPLWMFSYCTIFLSYGKISLMSIWRLSANQANLTLNLTIWTLILSVTD